MHLILFNKEVHEKGLSESHFNQEATLSGDRKIHTSALLSASCTLKNIEMETKENEVKQTAHGGQPVIDLTPLSALLLRQGQDV